MKQSPAEDDKELSEMSGSCHSHNLQILYILYLLVMAALHSRCGHYIFVLWFLSFFYSSPNLSGRTLDVYHTSTHGVALVRI